MNLGAILLTIAILGGLKISYAVMYPLPVVGVQLGQWSMNVVVLGIHRHRTRPDVDDFYLSVPGNQDAVLWRRERGSSALAAQAQ